MGCLLAAFGWIGEWRSPLNGDAAWALYAARSILHGARLYTDIIEINPPLIFWLDLPVVAIAAHLGLSPISLYRWTVILLTLASWALCCRLIFAGGREADPVLKRWLPLLLIFVTATIAIGYFGQREHLLLLLVLPYLVLVARRAEGGVPERGLAAACGLMAGIGIALKPHFLLLWLGTAVYGLARPRQRPLWREPEQLGIATILLAYAMAFLVFAIRYLDVVRRLGAAYLAFSWRSIGSILLSDIHPLTVLAALAIFALACPARCRQAVAVFAVSAAALLAAAVLQHKGFGYHFYPAVAVSMILLGLIAVTPNDERYPLRGAASRVLAVLVFATSGALFGWTALGRAAGWPNDRTSTIRRTAAVVSQRAHGGTIAVLSTRLGDAFPLVLESNVEWALRFPHLWWLRARPGTGAASAAERWCSGAVAEDLQRHRPTLILVRDPAADGLGLGEQRVDVVASLSRDPGFVREFALYQRVGRSGPFQLYERLGAGALSGAR